MFSDKFSASQSFKNSFKFEPYGANMEDPFASFSMPKFVFDQDKNLEPLPLKKGTGQNIVFKFPEEERPQQPMDFWQSSDFSDDISVKNFGYDQEEHEEGLMKPLGTFNFAPMKVIQPQVPKPSEPKGEQLGVLVKDGRSQFEETPHSSSKQMEDAMTDLATPVCSKAKKPTKRRPRRNLAVRQDVMNKNFFRAFKRYFKNLFNQYVKDNNLSKKPEDISDSVSLFSEFFFDKVEDSEEKSNADIEIFSSYVKVLVNYCQMKKQKLSEAEKRCMTETYDVLYSYSHLKFFEYISRPEIKIMLKKVIADLGIEGFVATFANANVAKYQTHVSKILKTL